MEEEKSIYFQCKLKGCAAEIILEKIEERKKAGILKYGKETATQALLCELYYLRKESKVRP